MSDHSRAAGRRTAVHALVAALATMLLLAFGATGAPADQNTRINGWSDQNIAKWPHLAHEVGHAVGLPRARFIVNWDAALHRPGPSGCSGDSSCEGYVEAARWIRAAQDKGMQVLISFSYSGARLPEPICTSSDPDDCLNYRYAIDQFRVDFPDVTEFTAWNEPNHNPADTPERVARGEDVRNPDAQAAARYWNQLNEACQTRSSTGKTCTAIAGDFSDYDLEPAGAGSYNDPYTQAYKAAIRGTPTHWAIHAYDAVATGNASTLKRWVGTYTDGRPVWITEVGAFYCTKASGVLGTTSQDASARNLIALMHALPPSVRHVFYWLLAPANGTSVRCSDTDRTEDDPALVQNGTYRPALRTLFPQLQPPAASTDAASDVLDSGATLNGSVDPRRLPTTYRFEYGKTTSYGRSTPVPEGDAGVGSGAVGKSATISGLEPDTTYHYRIVASNAMGTTHGSDRTFRTWDVETGSTWATRDAETQTQWLYHPDSAGTVSTLWNSGQGWAGQLVGSTIRPSTVPAVLRAATGTQWVYHVSRAGQIASSWNSGSGWASNVLGGNVAPGTSPTVLRDTDTNVQWLYYVNAAGQIASFWHDGRSWAGALIGGDVAPGTSPTVIRDPRTNVQWLYYVNRSGQVASLWHDGTSWAGSPIGGSVMPGTSPTVVRDPRSGTQWLYYVNTLGQIASFWNSGAGWAGAPIGGDAKTGTSPTLVRDMQTGIQWIYYVNRAGQIATLWNDGRSWAGALIGGADIMAGASPTAMRDAATGRHWVSYRNAEGGISQMTSTGSGWTGEQLWAINEHRPDVESGAASTVRDVRATLGGTVDPNGEQTTYRFEYGKTTAYGRTTTAASAGAGASTAAVAQDVAGLAPDTLYHYRLVATNRVGTRVGGDRTFRTREAQTGSTWTTRDTATGVQWLYYPHRGGTVGTLWNSGSGWAGMTIPSSVGVGTMPTVVRDSAGGTQWLYYVNDSGALATSWNSGPGWATTTIGGRAQVGSTPSVVRDAGTDTHWVYYVNDAGALATSWSVRAAWATTTIGGSVATGTSPVAIRDPASEVQWVYYANRAGQIASHWHTAGAWSGNVIGGDVGPGTSPRVIRDASTGVQWLYYVNRAGQIASLWHDGLVWSGSAIGGSVAAGTSPTVVRDASTGTQWLYYVNRAGQIATMWNSGAGWVGFALGGSVMPGTSPTAEIDADDGTHRVRYARSDGAVAEWRNPGSGWVNTDLGGDYRPPTG